MTGIVNLPLVPLRGSDTESSEMTSQLLFGECVEVIKTRDQQFLLRNLADNYVGWVDKKMIRILNKHEQQSLSELNVHCVCTPLIEGRNTETGEKLLLPGGSKLHFQEGSELNVHNKTFFFDPIHFSEQVDKTGASLVRLAKQYLNAPYLWGGKSIMGIDCSGLVQVVFSMCGIQLPRDASQQVELGKVIDFLYEVKPGDLAFFENGEGEIVHVGILLNSHQIIHASGCVKIETIDSQGIISEFTDKYSHNLRVVKRIL